MKLIVAGASGFVATEVIRQSLSIPSITSVLALARRPVLTPKNPGPSADASKLQSIVLDDYGVYPDDVKKKLAGAGACIWTVAITPSKSRDHEFDEVRRVCQDNALAGLQAIFESRGEVGKSATPFRFIYMSGVAAERDQTKTPSYMPAYSLMRGETENRVLAFAAEHKDVMEACVVKPGLITATGQIFRTAFAAVLGFVGVVPNVDVKDVAAAMLHQVINGFEKEPLQNDDLARIGKQALKESV